MQLMPATAREMGFPDISTAEDNVEAGAKYMRHVIDTYFSDAEHNPELEDESAKEQAYAFALAAYNAGPTRISTLRRAAARRGVDSRIWFGGMDGVVAREVSAEPVIYVRNITVFSIQFELGQRLLEQQERVLGAEVASAVAPGR